MKASHSRKFFIAFDVFFLSLLMLITLYPLIYVLFASFSDPAKLVTHTGALLWPQGFSLMGYELLIKDALVVRSFLNSFFILFSGVSINILFTVLGAYFLSRKHVYWKKFVIIFILFTMYFNGGLIPLYLTVNNLGMYNTYWALILPGAISTTNLLILRTAFMSVPDSLEEAATIDGAGHFRILMKVVLPLTLPTIAVLVLYYGVAHWNSWFPAMIYLKDRALYPLQLVLRDKLILNQAAAMAGDTGEQAMIGETIKYSIIVLSSLPMLCLYPFIQKYFVKGVMIGAIKG